MFMQSRLVRRLRVDGKRATAERIVRGARENLRRRGYERPSSARLEGLRARAPLRGRRTEKRGWKKLRVPTALSPEAQRKEGRRRLRDTIRESSGVPAADILARELHLALNGRGAVLEKRARRQKQAVQGRAGLGPVRKVGAAQLGGVSLNRSPRSFRRAKKIISSINGNKGAGASRGPQRWKGAPKGPRVGG